MRSHELTLGRSFGVTFDHGEDFFTALREFCQQNKVCHGYIPSFIAGFSEVQIVGACEKLDDPQAPVWSVVHLTNVEAFGGGTLAYEEAGGRVAPHIHVSVGLKEHSATGHTSHCWERRSSSSPRCSSSRSPTPRCTEPLPPTSTTCPCSSSCRPTTSDHTRAVAVRP